MTLALKLFGLLAATAVTGSCALLIGATQIGLVRW